MAEKLVSGVSGTVWKIQCSVGKAFAQDDELFILESMKMEIPVTPEQAGVLTELRVGPGDVVTEGQVLGLYEPASS